ncbi:transposase [Piscirickettsia salmonis]|uniref:transposase n=1 Tax=Piscirickettsia salmonis TaxID=1238 RepID=UPI0012FE9D3D
MLNSLFISWRDCNASFHESKGVKGEIEDAGCHLFFLSLYSPDLNPIEHVWSPLKKRVSMKLDQDEINLEAAISQVIEVNVRNYSLNAISLIIF